MAARLQALADQDCVLITGATHRLVVGRFVVAAKGTPTLKGGADPLFAPSLSGVPMSCA